jgi:hypothetical protein
MSQILEILARLDALTTSLGTIAKTLGEVSGAFHRTRRQGMRIAIALAVSFALDVALTIVVTLLSVSSLNQASAVHSSQLAACAVGNQGRVEQQQLWGYLFQLSGGAKTPQERQLLQFVDKTFAPVNCAQLYK